MQRPFHIPSTLVVFFSCVSLLPSTALATHPDNEGERGIELQVGFGIAGWGTTDDSISFMPSELSTGTLGAVTGPGLALRGAVGYRFNPWLSAGVSFGWQSVGSAGQYTVSEAALGARDGYSSWQMGVYARFYPLAYTQRWYEHPRVFFTGPTDLRRLDPWVSLGVDYISAFNRTRTYSDPSNLSTWNTTYVGIPIGFGLDYRLVQAFAIGIALTLTPMFSGSTDATHQDHVFRPGYDVVSTTTTSYTPASSTNFETFFGLTARYTFTL